MNCLFCKTDLNNGNENGCYECNCCSIPAVSYICNGSVTRPTIQYIVFKIDPYMFVELNYFTNSLKIFKLLDYNSDAKLIGGVDHIPDNINPDNVESIMNRLLKLQAFA